MQLDPELPSSAVRENRWTMAEDKRLVVWQQEFGSTWTDVAPYLPGRSVLQIKARSAPPVIFSALLSCSLPSFALPLLSTLPLNSLSFRSSLSSLPCPVAWIFQV